jgi:sec-independent protein translocase protein TatA
MLDLVAMGLSPTQWLIVILIVLLLFGGSRIPEMMKGLGSGIKEFKKGLQEGEDEESDTKR